MTELDIQDVKNLVYLLMALRDYAVMDGETWTLWNAMLHTLEAIIEQAE